MIINLLEMWKGFVGDKHLFLDDSYIVSVYIHFYEPEECWSNVVLLKWDQSEA